MNIKFPAPRQIPALRQLWKTAFGDEDGFLDGFFSTAFSPERSRCMEEDGQVLAVLYWFDVCCQDRKLAYIYAVATDPGHRNRGLCRRLMEDTASVLKSRGYAGALLVPCEPGLISMYAKMGFTPCTAVSEFRCEAGSAPIPLRRVDAGEYARLRREMLPPDSVIQEGANLTFLQTYAEFITGDHFLAAVSRDGDKLHCQELLGDPTAAPGILRALGCSHGHFRTPGTKIPHSMFLPLTENCPTPAYFGLAFD